MNKSEFIEILTESLKGEIPEIEIQNNIRYYTDFINQEMNKGESEESVLEKLGSPRLIARTIIDTNQMRPHQDSTNEYDSDSNYQGAYNDGNGNNYNDQNNYDQGNWNGNPKPWYTRALNIAILVLVVMAVIFLGSVAMNLIFTFGMPILFIILIINLFRRR